MAVDPAFILLRPILGWLPSDQTRDLLGSIVKNCFDPTANSTPRRPLRFNDQGFPPLINTYDQFVLGLRGDRTRTNRFSLNGVLDLRGRRDDINILSLQGKRITYKRLQQHTRFWRRMTSESDDVLPEVKSWLQEKSRLRRRTVQPYWVTGVLMCQDVVIAATETDAESLTLQGDLPIGTLGSIATSSMGVPIDFGSLGNVKGEHSRVSSASRCFLASSDEGQIFALQVRQVVIEGGVVQTTDAQPKVSSGRRLGASSSTTEKLISQEMDEEMWSELLDQISEEQALQ